MPVAREETHYSLIFAPSYKVEYFTRRVFIIQETN